MSPATLKPMITHFWRGGYGLGVSFWLFGAVGNLAAAGLAWALLARVDEPPLPMVVAIGLAGSMFQGWLIVGLWRSADRHPDPPGPALAVRVAVCLYALVALATLLQWLGILALAALVFLNPPFIR